MTTKRNGKEQAARINRLIDFIEMKSEAKFPRIFIQDILLVFGSMYDLHALLCYFKWAQDHHESDDTILKTILYDLDWRPAEPRNILSAYSGIFCRSIRINGLPAQPSITPLKSSFQGCSYFVPRTRKQGAIGFNPRRNILRPVSVRADKTPLYSTTKMQANAG